MLGDFAGQNSREEACLDFEDAAIRNLVVEDGVRDELVHAAFVGADNRRAGRRLECDGAVELIYTPGRLGIEEGQHSADSAD